MSWGLEAQGCIYWMGFHNYIYDKCFLLSPLLFVCRRDFFCLKNRGLVGEENSWRNTKGGRDRRRENARGGTPDLCFFIFTTTASGLVGSLGIGWSLKGGRSPNLSVRHGSAVPYFVLIPDISKEIEIHVRWLDRSIPILCSQHLPF